MDKPWGEVRYSWTSTPVTTPSYTLSKYTFTGQYSYMDDPSTSGVSEGFGLLFYNARMYDPALGRFTSADSIVPGGVQGLDRYAYVNNNPVNFNDPTGHDPNPWNPFAFDTLIVQVGVNLEFIGGINVQLEGILDLKTLKEYEFNVYDIEIPQPEMALAVSATETAGFQGEGAVIGSVYGTNDSVGEIINNNVSTILDDATLPAHLEVCYEFCLGAGYNFDPADPNWSAGESVSYSGGYGYGVSIGLDVAEARDWAFHYTPETGWKSQWPTRLKEYLSEATRDFKKLLAE